MKDLIRKARVHTVYALVHNKPSLLLPDTSIVIAPHPDDEIIGCGGLIRQLLKAGKQLDVVILSGGEKSHSGCCQIDEKTLIEARRNLSRQAAQVVGLPLEHLHFLNYPDGCITYNHAETKRLKQLITEMKPDAIFIPHKEEGWSDHIEAGQIVQKLIAGNNNIQIYEYCVWFWYYNSWHINWRNARLVKMSKDEYQCKLKAMDAYIIPLAPCGKPWSGVLPRVFVKANRWDKELYFKVK